MKYELVLRNLVGFDFLKFGVIYDLGLETAKTKK